MSQILADLNNIQDLEIILEKENVKEIAFLDANIIINGNFPYINKEGIIKKRMKNGESQSQAKNNWWHEVKHERAIMWNWLQQWYLTKGIKRSVMPVIASLTFREITDALHKEYKNAKRIYNWTEMTSKSPYPAYIKLSGQSSLPEELDSAFLRYAKEKEANDRALLGIAFYLCQNTNLKITFVSNDGDFRIARSTFEKYKMPDRRYLSLQTPQEFRERLQIPLIPKPKEKKFEEDYL